MAATGRGASMGVLYKNAEALQRAADIKTVLLDKTATLTEGKPKVVSFEGEEGAKRIAYALEIKLDHPLSRCIAGFCGEGEHAEEVEYLTGLGAHGFVNGKEYFLGNDRLMKEKNLPFGHGRSASTPSPKRAAPSSSLQTASASSPSSPLPIR